MTDRRALRTAVRALGALDVLVANAGTGDITSLSGDDEIDELFDRIVRINLVGAFNTVRAALPTCATAAASSSRARCTDRRLRHRT